MFEILKKAKTIAVVGLSANPSRTSYGVAAYLQRNGYRIIPVNPNENEVLGEKSYPSIVDLPEVPDLVNVFRRSELVMPVVEECIAKGVKFIWFQEGVINQEAISLAEKNGIKVVFDQCILKVHARIN